jgi:hypothetical protein
MTANDKDLDINSVGCVGGRPPNVSEQLLIEGAGRCMSAFAEELVMIPTAKHRDEDHPSKERAEAISRCTAEVETIASTPGAERLLRSGLVRDGAIVAPAGAFR